jgi:hypothetical protein
MDYSDLYCTWVLWSANLYDLGLRSYNYGIDQPSHYGISLFSIEMCMQLEKERGSMCVRKYKACAKK